MNDTAIVVSNTGNNWLAPATRLDVVLATYQAKRDFIKQVLCEGTDYGKIPGAGDKPALLKPGAEKMASFFGLAPSFEDVETVEDWTGETHNGEPFFYYRQKCKLYSGERMIASADGSCNSWEKKYRYRNADRVCPNCGKPTIIKGKAEYGGGWICFARKGGCGSKFQNGDKAIEGQEIGQVKNPDVAEQVNTILKMAQKRALVAATLIATNASDYFTQDIEDYTTQDIVEAVFTVTTQRPEPAQPTAQIDPSKARPLTPPAPIPSNGKAREAQIVSEITGQPEELPAAPDKPWTSTKVSMETAQTAKTSQGDLYWTLDDAALAQRYNGCKKGMEKPALTQEQVEGYQLRMDIIQAILDYRKS